MKKNNIAKKVNKNLERLERVEFLMVKRFFITLGYGLLAQAGINIVGFIIGTIVYTDESALHLKVDAFAKALGEHVFLGFFLVSMIFVVRFLFYRNQTKILKSVQ